MEDRYILGAKKSINLTVTFFIFLCLSYLSYQYSSQVAQHKNEELSSLFQNAARQLSDLLREKTKPFPLLLRAARGAIPDGREVAPEQWSHFVDSLNLDYQDFGIIGLTFTESVAHIDKDAYIKGKQLLFPDFRVFPEGERSEYMVLAYSAPESISDKVRGYDIGFEQHRRAAAIEARDSGQVALSHPISLIPTNSGSLDYLLLYPVYDLQQRTFRGWTTIGFSLSNMAGQAISVAGKGLHLRLYDYREQETPVFASMTPAVTSPAMQFNSYLYLGNQDLPLQILPAVNGPFAVALKSYDLKTLQVLVALSALVSFIVYLLLNSRYAAVQMANRLLDKFSESESRYRSLFELSPEAIIIHRAGRVVLANRAAQSLMGVSIPDQLIGRNILDFVDDSSKELVLERMGQLPTAGSLPFVEEVLKRYDGSAFLAEVSGALIQFEGEQAVQVLFRDISSEVEMRYESQISKAVFRYSNESMMVTDANGVIRLVNPAFTEATGFSQEEVKGRKASVLSSGYHDANFYRDMWLSLMREGEWEGEITNRKKAGDLYIQRTHISAIRNGNGDITQYACVMGDVTEQKQELEKIRYQALHDPLTRLPNRPCFIAEVNQALECARLNDEKLAVLFVDLDGFKPVNDTYGHLMGDQLLVALAGRLSAFAEGRGAVARVGGDEFLVMLNDSVDLSSAERSGRELSALVGSAVIVEGVRLVVGASVGVSVYPDHGSDALTLIDQADKAMYQIKVSGKGSSRLAG